MGNMMAYKGSMLMVFFNYGMVIANYLGTLMFPVNTPQVATYEGSLLKGVEVFASFGNVNTILGLLLTAGVLALFAFSLLIPTIPFIFMFFALNGIITSAYISQLNLPIVFTTPLVMGIAIVYYVGISQYAARSSLYGA